jgi:hypothetical protein
VSGDKINSLSIYKLWFVEGFKRWKGYIMALQRNPDLEGPAAYHATAI